MLSSLALALLTLASADPLPASVRACTAEADRDLRLACFDRETARFPVPKAAHSEPVAPTSSTPAKASTAPPAGVAAAAPSPTAKPGPSAIHILSIDHIPNEMVIHLDNGQTWQQTQSAAGDLSLKVGDIVKIEHHLGSDWLIGPHVSSMKVRQQP
jgi:hypothetical protein